MQAHVLPTIEPPPDSGQQLSPELLLRIHDLMLKTRVLEERLIKMHKQGDGFFWIGGPGEEAFNVPLGLLADKGQGLDHDYLHLHYRSSGTLLAMGADPIDALRQMKNTATDPYSGGRNFAGHSSIRKWNVVPISSPIEVQFSMAPGTALAQKRANSKGITIVQGGDAGTAEGDFATCLVWSTRPGNELPLLMVVTNNGWGISTSADTQHGEQNIADRGKAFGIKTKVINGNDVEESYRELKAAMDYVRSERRPFLLEARVSRLYGHSSASGANYVKHEVDCLRDLESKLEQRGLGNREAFDERRKQLTEELLLASQRVIEEPQPEGSSIWRYVYADKNVVGGEVLAMATLVQAVRMALHVAEDRLGVTDIFGEDVGPPLGGVFTATQGLRTAWNTPLDERGIVGMAMGLALAGQRPVAEIQFCDYAFNTVDLLKLAGSMYWSSYGDWNCPMTLMTPVGSGIRGSIYHSHSFDAQATRLPGWKVVMPSNPLDAYGLLLSAVVDPNPVMVLLPKALMRHKAGPGEMIPGEPDDDRALGKMIDAPLGDRTRWQPQWPATPDLFVPIGKMRAVRPGRDVTVVAYGRMVQICKKVADELSAEGIEVEVIDLRSLYPYDWEGLRESIVRTRRVLFVNEDTEVTNFGEHLLRRTVEELFPRLAAAPRVLAGKHVPGIGLSDNLERASVPQREDIIEALREMAGESLVDRVRSGEAERIAARAPSRVFTLTQEDIDAGETFRLVYCSR